MLKKKIARHGKWHIVYRLPADKPANELRAMPSTKRHQLAKRLADLLISGGCWNVRVERV